MIRILIAEDMDALREDLAASLSSQPDFEVVGAAASGAEIVRLASDTPFDLLLMDIEMETADDGIRAAERILEQKPGARISFLTIHDTDDIILSAMATGAQGYVFKGCDKETLFTHVRAMYKNEMNLEARVQEVVQREYARLRKSEESLLFFIHSVSRLTTAERELVRYLLMGYNVPAIARARSVEVITVKTQVKGLLRKFQCARTKEMVHLIRKLRIEHLFLHAPSA